MITNLSKPLLTTLVVAAVATFAPGCSKDSKADKASSTIEYPYNAVSFTEVTIDDPFWSPRLETTRTVTVPLAFDRCKTSGRYDNFVKAANPSPDYEVGGFPFDDTDVYKSIEGASYLLRTMPNPELEQRIDSIITLIAAAQEPDGYLNTPYTMNPEHPHPWMAPGQRWVREEELSHELYNLGHLAEAAVAHYEATGSRRLLDIACAYADCAVRSIGDGEGQVDIVPGHQIAEMALAKLYLATGNEDYLNLAKRLLDRRGYTTRRDAYTQAHMPVREQTYAVGHAVRAGYMYAGMADVAALTGDTDYVNAVDSIWQDIVAKKMYLTGGVGARSDGESFGDPYELPNHTAYCETCAAIASVFMNHRLLMLHGDARYADVLERTLYNGVLSGISLTGDAFFYPNPLASEGEYGRKAWFGCACCPSNLSRFLPSVAQYIYTVHDNDIYVNLYIGSKATVDLPSGDVTISQSGDYVGTGNVKLDVNAPSKSKATICLRVPGRLAGNPLPSSDLYTYADNRPRELTAKLGDETLTLKADADGYCRIPADKLSGKTLDIQFDMTPRAVVANEKVAADRGRVAFERGPLVLCAEAVDNEGLDLSAVIVDADQAAVDTTAEGLPGIPAVSVALKDSDKRLTLVPYYAWANRAMGPMRVWLKAQADAAPDQPGSNADLLSHTEF